MASLDIGEATLGYRPELDGLRAFAVLAVVLFHYWPEQVPGGYLGVDLFFVLSGFLITRLLLEERAKSGAISLRRFYRRRFARLAPALLVMLATVTIVAVTTHAYVMTDHELRIGLSSSVLYFANTLASRAELPGVLGPLWSLSVEEQFYVVWPAVVCLCSRWGLRAVRAVAIGGLVAVGVDLAIKVAIGTGWRSLYFETDTHGAGALMVGCIMATIVPVASAASPRRARRWTVTMVWFAAAAVTVYLAATVRNPNRALYRGGFIAAAIVMGVVIVGVLRFPLARRTLGARPLAYVGRLSYSLYLWHIPVYFYLLSLDDRGLSAARARWLALVLSFVVAMASHHIIEQPLRRALTRQRRQRRAAPAPTPASAGAHAR